MKFRNEKKKRGRRPRGGDLGKTVVDKGASGMWSWVICDKSTGAYKKKHASIGPSVSSYCNVRPGSAKQKIIL